VCEYDEYSDENEDVGMWICIDDWLYII